jgi:hypothetical protein
MTGEAGSATTSAESFGNTSRTGPKTTALREVPRAAPPIFGRDPRIFLLPGLRAVRGSVPCHTPRLPSSSPGPHGRGLPGVDPYALSFRGTVATARARSSEALRPPRHRGPSTRGPPSAPKHRARGPTCPEGQEGRILGLAPSRRRSARSLCDNARGGPDSALPKSCTRAHVAVGRRCIRRALGLKKGATLDPGVSEVHLPATYCEKCMDDESLERLLRASEVFSPGAPINRRVLSW